MCSFKCSFWLGSVEEGHWRNWESKWGEQEETIESGPQVKLGDHLDWGGGRNGTKKADRKLLGGQMDLAVDWVGGWVKVEVSRMILRFLVYKIGWCGICYGEEQWMGASFVGRTREFSSVYDCTYFLELVGRTLPRRNLSLFFKNWVTLLLECCFHFCVQQSESVICIHISPLFRIFLI